MKTSFLCSDMRESHYYFLKIVDTNLQYFIMERIKEYRNLVYQTLILIFVDIRGLFGNVLCEHRCSKGGLLHIHGIDESVLLKPPRNVNRLTNL